GHSPSPARPSGVGTIADGCVAALGNMPDIPCGLRLALGDCAHSESHLFMGQDTSVGVRLSGVAEGSNRSFWCQEEANHVTDALTGTHWRADLARNGLAECWCGDRQRGQWRNRSEGMDDGEDEHKQQEDGRYFAHYAESFGQCGVSPTANLRAMRSHYR
ncbi:MAG: hypothetical protein OXF31_06270, partial [Gammaproteobacteria bacterium]|nr:hypothetical protein [Gammaproteobacteria bacterium]